MTDDEKLEKQKSLALEGMKVFHGASANRWEKRRSYEWNLTYAVWAALAAYIVAIVSGKVTQGPPGGVTIAVLSGIALFHLVYLWCMTTLTLEDLRTNKVVEQTILALVEFKESPAPSGTVSSPASQANAAANGEKHQDKPFGSLVAEFERRSLLPYDRKREAAEKEKGHFLGFLRWMWWRAAQRYGVLCPVAITLALGGSILSMKPTAVGDTPQPTCNVLVEVPKPVAEQVVEPQVTKSPPSTTERRNKKP